MNTDFASHRIEGYARAAEERGIDGSFSVPLISHIEGNLWQGGCQPGARLPDDFAFVLSLYPWGRYELGPNTRRIEIEMYDAGRMPNIAQLHDLAAMVNAAKREGKTLIHCQAGLNRSGLVAGLSLVLEGMAPSDAVRLLREKRCDMVLCNATFENWLLNYQAVPA